METLYIYLFINTQRSQNRLATTCKISSAFVLSIKILNLYLRIFIENGEQK